MIIIFFIFKIISTSDPYNHVSHLDIVFAITSKSFKLTELVDSCNNFPWGKTVLEKNVSDSSKQVNILREFLTDWRCFSTVHLKYIITIHIRIRVLKERHIEYKGWYLYIEMSSKEKWFFGPPASAGRVLRNRVCPSVRPSVCP